MHRQIILDTETTGLKPEDGHRMVEFYAQEYIDRKFTGKSLHLFVNPEGKFMDAVVVNIHGITNERARSFPKIGDVAAQIVNFLKGAEIIAHNADFDSKFIDAELQRANKGRLWDHVSRVTCTLKLARSIDPKARKNKLDDLCDRYGVDRTMRDKHAADIDVKLLAEVYLKMTEGMTDIDIERKIEQTDWVRPATVRFEGAVFVTPKVDALDLTEHQAYLDGLEKETKATPVWSKDVSPRLSP